MSYKYSMILGNLGNTCDRGWLSMDQYPYREDGAGAIVESILWVRKYEKIVDEYFKEIEALILTNDAIETSRFLRKLF
jgi:xylose isomerase